MRETVEETNPPAEYQDGNFAVAVRIILRRASAARVRYEVPQHDHTERHSEYPRNDVSHRSSLCRNTGKKNTIV